MEGGGRILYTRDLDARHISMKTEGDRQKGRQRQSETNQQTDRTAHN